MYRVQYSDRVVKQLHKMDKKIRKMILDWIDKNLESCENPRAKGKGLVANRSGQWRYRVGDYRIICDIQDQELIILALSVSHRKKAY